jgi:hypothetical protein
MAPFEYSVKYSGRVEHGAGVEATVRPTYKISKKQALEVVVVFTSTQGTLAALKQAGELADQLNARIRVIEPQVVPYPLPLEAPSTTPLFRSRQFRTLAPHHAIATRLEVLLCRDRQECLLEKLPPESIILIGGRKRWWPTPESKLARLLSRAGHHVLFVTT